MLTILKLFDHDTRKTRRYIETTSGKQNNSRRINIENQMENKGIKG